MLKLMRALHRNQKGFTLVELMVVVVIIGILVAIAIPIFNAVQGRAQEQAHAANVRTLEGVAAMFIAENPNVVINVTGPDGRVGGAAGTGLDPFIDEWPIVPRMGGYYTVAITPAGDITVTPAVLTP